MMKNKPIAIIGSACGWGAQRRETAQGPDTLQSSKLLQHIQSLPATAEWTETIYAHLPLASPKEVPTHQAYPYVIDHLRRLSFSVEEALVQNLFPLVIGGDHGMAIAIWGAVTTHFKAEQKFGLLWIDAHLDAHTCETSPSDAIHGMPVASLLGYGDKTLQGITGNPLPKIAPEHLVYVGVRSFEKEEYELLQRLGVKIFDQEEVQTRGLEAVMAEAEQIVTQGTAGFGISIDLDGFDPQVAPGVGSPEPGGLPRQETLQALRRFNRHPHLMALEIAEFNPALDIDDKTAQLVLDLCDVFFAV